jgi:CO/xanthine dehydrogenase Mo-binding subunit
MKEAEIILDETYRTQSTSPLALEPRYSLASWESGRLTVWKASRNVYGDREKLAQVYALPHDRVRVIAAYMGGGFGSKDETRLGAITAIDATSALNAGPYGAKALGEPPLVSVAAAIANAVYDATGVRIRELPITAEKVLGELRQRSR